MPNEIDDDMAASAISLDASATNALKSFHQANTSFAAEVSLSVTAQSTEPAAKPQPDTENCKKSHSNNCKKQKKVQFLLDSTHQNDLENSILFKKKARPRCLRQTFNGSLSASNLI